MNDEEAINSAVQFLKDRGYSIPVDVLKALSSNHLIYELTNDDKLEIMKSIKAEMKQAGDYQSIRNEMWAAVYDSVYDFLNSNSHVGTYNRPMATAVSKAYIEATEIAYVDGGGNLPIDEDTAAWARSELSAQLSYIDSLFTSLKQLRKEGEFDSIHEAFRHADGYANSLDGFYNSVKVAGAGNKMLTFEGDDGKESCSDCKRYKGQRHRASWWKSRNAIPPSRSFECGGYHCEHRLYDDDGEEFTV